MKNKLVVEIAEGLGNQLFKYAFAYSLAKKINYELLIDDKSGYSRKKNKLRNHQKYMLNFLNIEQIIAPDKYKYNSFFKRLIKKIEIFIDNFRGKKRFILETNKKINGEKIVNYLNFPDENKLCNKLYVSGYFENEKYFKHFKKDLIELYKPLPKFIKSNYEIIEKLKSTNSVSIHIRQHRFSEQLHEKKDKINMIKSEKFLKELILYVNKSVIYFEKTLTNPKFFIWSNDFINLEKYFDKKKFTFVTGNDAINDFNLFSYSNHFIVGASTFHWWGAWLNDNPNKICLYPSNLNPSGNIDFWPKEWISI